MTITAANFSASSIHADALSTYPCYISVAIPTPQVSAQCRGSPAIPVVPKATILPCAGVKGPSNTPTTFPD